ncbi:MOSC domain protein [Aspergillus steynii IBT 23096]|uniref:MOSC domain protein n=1 Tax=Aspergillus steynii IBT 23096 TaxID=1392250 RepID=A0A2I2G2F0_9EURO|nr:MOSC domain protein [Aspergillus steynii IBT 23096]PLB47049.1 MOSC domain protein [Aspergillus steynii IBT 23096]
MKVTQLYTYPIKSIRGVALSEAAVTGTGFHHDRRFMLLKVKTSDDGTETLQNMHVPHFPEMSLFLTDIVFPTEGKNDGQILVTYRPPGVDDNADPRVKTLAIPLQPDVRGREELGIIMHQSPTKGYNMGSEYNDWFSECFGYRVVLAYLGPNWRPVLGSFPPAKSAIHGGRRQSTTSPVSTRSLAILATLTLLLNAVGVPMVREKAGQSLLPSVVATAVAVLLSLALSYGWSAAKKNEEKITFADSSPYLVVSETSVDDVSARLAGDEVMDVTKSRPNIVVAGAAKAFEEDFWAELTVGKSARLLLTANCVRCQSLNVDYATGKMGTGESGSVLKKLMKDRRVDKGAKYSPVFGRYSFLDPESENVLIRVGDEVAVTKTADERTVYDWPGLS